MIRGKHVCPRAIGSRDVETLRRRRNYPDIGRFFADTVPITEPEQETWFERMAANPRACRLIVEKDGHFAGAANIKDINWIQRAGSYGIYRIPGVSNDALPAEAAIPFVDWCFDCLNLRNIHGDVLDPNARSRRFRTGLGFQEEGVCRKRVFHQGECHDLVAVGIFREEYKKDAGKYRKFLFGE